MPDKFVFRLRRGPSNIWAEKNTVLGPGEPGIEIDTGWFKIGDGVTPWNDLPYFVDRDSAGDGASDPALAAHVSSETPHPVYDEGPSLVLLYENAKV